MMTMERLPHWVRGVLLVSLCILAAWLVIPTWDALQPTRNVLIPLIAGYFAVIAWLLVALPERLRGRSFLAILTLVATATAALVGVHVSMKVGQAATVAASSLGGCWFASWLLRRDKDSAITLGLIPLYSLTLISFALAGAIEPSPPDWILLLVPATPLLLWLFAFGPLSRLQPIPSIGWQVLVVVIAITIIAACLLLKAEPEEEWSYSPRTIPGLAG